MRFVPLQEEKIFLLSMFLGLTLGPIQAPVQWAPGALSPGLKLARHDAHHSPQFSAEVKNGVELFRQSFLRLHGVLLN